ncbi:TPA: 50S ribosomal protein L25 [Candidatus Latescibacteria bacterium]|nr:50S ribosomal protein L25 [Candidatus Latescibacterota bacterium]
MADSAVLEAQARELVGKGVSRRLRRDGAVPAVVYGSEIDSVKCTVDSKAFRTMIHNFGRNAIVTLKLEGGSEDYSTIVKEIQHHPVSHDILHIDFHRISMTQKIVVEVAVHSEGTPIGVRNDGGILEHMLHEIEIECLPTNIPSELTYDVTELNIGDTVHVSDLVAPEGTTFVTESDRSVFAVAPPTVRQDEDEETEEGEGAEVEEGATEPEVIERGKKDDDEGDEE